MNATTTMSIAKRLRDVFRLRPRHDEPTSESQYPIASRGFGRLFRSKSRRKQFSTGECPPIIQPLRPQSIFWPSLLDVTSATLAHTRDGEAPTRATIALQHSHRRTAFRRPSCRPSLFSLLDAIKDSVPPGGSIGHLKTEDGDVSNLPASGSKANLIAGPDDLVSADNEVVGSAPVAEVAVPPQTAAICKLPNELLFEIMALVLSAEPPYTPTHLRLLAPRHVCQDLRNVAKIEIQKTLNASARHFNASVERNSELRTWFTAESPDLVRHEVSFQLNRQSKPLDLDLVNHFVGALLNCRQAKVEIQAPADLFGRSFETLPIETSKSTVVPSHVHSFSWISATLGVRDPIPLNNFPWKVLVNDLPWSQLTQLSLDCPLSDLDAFDILTNGGGTLESVSLKLTRMNENISGNPVALHRLRSLTIETHFPIRDLVSQLALPALENLDLKSDLSAVEQELPLLNQHLDIPWSHLKTLFLSNRDTRGRRRCPVTAILMRCEQLQRFQWDGPSAALDASSIVLSFVMSQHLEELMVNSDAQGCELLLQNLLYEGNVIRRVNISHLGVLKDSPKLNTKESLRNWTHLTVSKGVTLSDISEILNDGERLTNASFVIIEGGDPLTSLTKNSSVSSGIQELELCTNIHIPPLSSLLERLDFIALQRLKISLEGGVYSQEILDDLAPFMKRYPNLPSPVISSIYPHLHCTTSYDIF